MPSRSVRPTVCRRRHGQLLGIRKSLAAGPFHRARNRPGRAIRAFFRGDPPTELRRKVVRQGWPPSLSSRKRVADLPRHTLREVSICHRQAGDVCVPEDH